MKIVVSLDDSVYKHIIEHSQGKRDFICASDCVKTFESIKNGTPLPKGHGDLIDRNELLKEPMDTANYPSNYVRIAKAIIEADKESEE